MYECQLIKAGIKSEYLNFANPESTLYTELERRSIHDDPTMIEVLRTPESMDDRNVVSQLKNDPNQVYCEIIAWSYNANFCCASVLYMIFFHSTAS